MGASMSLTPHVTEDEVAVMLSLSSAEPWAFDSDQWQNLFRFKFALSDFKPETLEQALNSVASRLASNNAASHNLMTLAYHVAYRLERVYYFNVDDVAMTTNAVVLLRVFLQHLIAQLPASTLLSHLQQAVNPPRGTPHPGATTFLWPDLVTAAVAFLTDNEVSAATYELHTQVLSLLLVACGTQLGSSELTAGQELEIASRETLAAAPAIRDPFLRALMVMGTTTYVPTQQHGAGAKSTSKKGGPATTTTTTTGGATAPSVAEGSKAGQQPAVSRAVRLTQALLRNVCIDGARTEDSSDPAPPGSSAAAAASLAVPGKKKSAGEKAAATRAAAGGEAGVVGKAVDAVVSVASSVASVPLSLVSSFTVDDGEPTAKPLYERSALLLLLLSNNFRAADGAAWMPNPYRAALASLTDDGSAAAGYGKALDGSGSGVSFKHLFTALCSVCDGLLGNCLLHALVMSNGSFASSLLVRTDIDKLLLPLLKQLYAITTVGSDHRYMLTTTIMVFAQDAAFCENAHVRVKLPGRSVSWVSERLLGDISLGSLLMLVLLRVVSATSSASAAGTNDALIHQHCFAAIANTAPYTQGIHPYAAQRLLSVLDSWHRKHGRLSAALAAVTGEASGTTTSGATGSASAAAAAAAAAADVSISMTPASATAVSEESVQRLSGLVDHYDQCIRILCEAILACCAPSLLPHNIPLLYVLLQERTVIASLAEDADFAEAAAELTSVIMHFSAVLGDAARAKALAHAQSGSAGAAEAAALAEAGSSGSSQPPPPVAWDDHEVSAVLAAAARAWKGGEAAERQAGTLKDMKFTYSEEADSAARFFVPYVYSLCLAYAEDLQWPAAAIRLCTPESRVLYL